MIPAVVWPVEIAVQEKRQTGRQASAVQGHEHLDRQEDHEADRQKKDQFEQAAEHSAGNATMARFCSWLGGSLLDTLQGATLEEGLE